MNEKVKKLRLMLRLTQFDIAKQSGVGRTRVSLYENGHVSLQPSEIASICAALEKAAADRVSAISSLSSAGQMPKIAACACQYNARIYELRRLGFRIANRTQDVDGVRHSWFRLVPESAPPQPAPEPATKAVVPSPPSQPPLFATGSFQRWGDDPEEGAQRGGGR